MIATRRAFLVGVGCILAAPAIVHAGNIMPVRYVDPYDTRALACYEISMDRFVLRIDRSLSPLLVPPKFTGFQVVPLVDVYKLIPQRAIENIRPVAGEQKYLSMVLEDGPLFDALCGRIG